MNDISESKINHKAWDIPILIVASLVLLPIIGTINFYCMKNHAWNDVFMFFDGVSYLTVFLILSIIVKKHF